MAPSLASGLVQVRAVGAPGEAVAVAAAHLQAQLQGFAAAAGRAVSANTRCLPSRRSQSCSLPSPAVRASVFLGSPWAARPAVVPAGRRAGSAAWWWRCKLAVRVWRPRAAPPLSGWAVRRSWPSRRANCGLSSTGHCQSRPSLAPVNSSATGWAATGLAAAGVLAWAQEFGPVVGRPGEFAEHALPAHVLEAAACVGVVQHIPAAVEPA